VFILKVLKSRLLGESGD